MNLIKPEKLKKGDTIGIIALSGAVESKQNILRAKKYFEKKGYNCLFLCNHESESFFSNANLQYQLSDTFDINEIESIRKMGPDLVVFDSYLADNIMDPINRTAKMKK